MRVCLETGVTSRTGLCGVSAPHPSLASRPPVTISVKPSQRAPPRCRLLTQEACSHSTGDRGRARRQLCPSKGVHPGLSAGAPAGLVNCPCGHCGRCSAPFGPSTRLPSVCTGGLDCRNSNHGDRPTVPHPHQKARPAGLPEEQSTLPWISGCLLIITVRRNEKCPRPEPPSAVAPSLSAEWCASLPELAQTHVHRVSDAVQPSHPRPTPSPPAFSLPQHQCYFQ